MVEALCGGPRRPHAARPSHHGGSSRGRRTLVSSACAILDLSSEISEISEILETLDPSLNSESLCLLSSSAAGEGDRCSREGLGRPLSEQLVNWWIMGIIGGL